MLVEERSSLSACGSVGILIYKETKETWLGYNYMEKRSSF